MEKKELESLRDEAEELAIKGESFIQELYDEYYKEYNELPKYDVMLVINKILFKRYWEINRILRKHMSFKLMKMDNIGDVMTFDEFKNDCKCGCFIDSDGDG